MIRLTERQLRGLISESVRRVLMEMSYYGGDMVKFVLYSKANGNLNVTVPYGEFMRTRYKIDYLWQKCNEQNPGCIKYKGNGTFSVAPGDPHANEIRL